MNRTRAPHRGDPRGPRRQLPGKRTHEELRNFPPPEKWDHHARTTRKRTPARSPHEYMLIPTTCFNCESACGLLALRRQGRPDDHQARGQPGAPRLARPQLRQGPGHDQPDQRPGADPVPAAPGRRPRRGPVGAGHLGRSARRHRQPDPGGDRRRPPRRGDLPRRAGPARTASPSASCRPGASTGTTRTPTSARPAHASGTALWGGYDRPSPDHANAKAILLLSSHLETGHYFNPHAQRIMEAKASGTKLVVMDPRMSNTASHADLWIAPWPGSEAAILLAVASHLLQSRQIDDRLHPALGQLGDLPRRAAP